MHELHFVMPSRTLCDIMRFIIYFLGICRILPKCVHLQRRTPVFLKSSSTSILRLALHRASDGSDPAVPRSMWMGRSSGRRTSARASFLRSNFFWRTRPRENSWTTRLNDFTGYFAFEYVDAAAEALALKVEIDTSRPTKAGMIRNMILLLNNRICLPRHLTFPGREVRTLPYSIWNRKLWVMRKYENTTFKGSFSAASKPNFTCK